MSSTDGLSLYLGGGKPIPIKADSLRFGVFVDKKTTSTVIFDGELGVTGSSNNEENRQKIEFAVPATYQDADIGAMIRKITQAGGKNGVLATLKNKAGTEIYRYKQCFVTDGGEVEDKDGRYITYTLEGVQIVGG